MPEKSTFDPAKIHFQHYVLMSVIACLQNMWDLTPPTELLQELPAEYSTESALADLIVSFFLFEYSDSSISFVQTCKYMLRFSLTFPVTRTTHYRLYGQMVRKIES
jgi:hypothetical protein